MQDVGCRLQAAGCTEDLQINLEGLGGPRARTRMGGGLGGCGGAGGRPSRQPAG